MALPQANAAAETRALASALAAVPYGGTITLEALSDVIKRPIRTCNHLLSDALEIVNTEQGAGFTSIRGIGYRRLEVAEAPLVTAVGRRRVVRVAGTASRRASNMIARANDVPNDVRLKVLKEIGTLNLLAHLASDAAQAAAPEPKGNKAESTASVARAMLEKISA